MTIQIRPIFADLGVRSARELIRKTGSPERSLRRQAQIASIGSLYLLNRGTRGPLGFPIGDVNFSGDVPFREFAGGIIECPDNGPQCEGQWQVSITYLGFHCHEESDWDQSSNSDEPYFVFGVVWGGGGNQTTKTQVYEDVDGGEDRFELMTIMSQSGPPPVGIIVLGAEHDWGTPAEAEAKLRDAIKDIEAKLEGAGKTFGAFAGGTAGADSHVMPQWARDIYLGWFVEWGVAGFGLGDDPIGKATKLIFDYDAALKQWKPIPVKGQFGGNDYNLTLDVKGEKEGNYTLYFKVNLMWVVTAFNPEFKSK
jgi:hypothetical protein